VEDERAAYGLQPSVGMQLQSSAGTQRQEAADSSIPMHNATIRNLQSTTNVHDHPGPYGTLPAAWQDAGSQLMSKVTNAKLAKYLIGMSSVIPMPESYWPEDGCQWSVTVMEHRPSKRHHGGHAFSVVLAESTPAYTGGAATDNPYVAELSSKQIRNGIEQHYGKNKTLQQMFDPKWKSVPTGMAHAALAFKNQLIRSVNQTTGTLFRKSTKSSPGNLKRKESAATGQCAAIATAMTVMTCEQNGIEFAGTPIVAPRHYHSVCGRPDEALWVEAIDKKVIKCFTMGTWQIVDTADIPPECNVMGTCFSYKVKSDCDGNLLECRARANVNGTQQKPGSYGETFAPTSKFSVIRTICALAAQKNLTLYQFDVKVAFLLAPCKEPVYMNLPSRYKLPPGKAFKCIKLLYGLKQSAFGWHEMISGWLVDHGFENLDSDGVTFKKEKKNKNGTTSKILLTIHVDDAIVATNDDDMYQRFLQELGTKFEVSASSKLTWFLGCKVEQYLMKGTVRLTPEKYCNDVLTDEIWRYFYLWISGPGIEPRIPW